MANQLAHIMSDSLNVSDGRTVDPPHLAQASTKGATHATALKYGAATPDELKRAIVTKSGEKRAVRSRAGSQRRALWVMFVATLPGACAHDNSAREQDQGSPYFAVCPKHRPAFEEMERRAAGLPPEEACIAAVRFSQNPEFSDDGHERRAASAMSGRYCECSRAIAQQDLTSGRTFTAAEVDETHNLDTLAAIALSVRHLGPIGRGAARRLAALVSQSTDPNVLERISTKTMGTGRVYNCSGSRRFTTSPVQSEFFTWRVDKQVTARLGILGDERRRRETAEVQRLVQLGREQIRHEPEDAALPLAEAAIPPVQPKPSDARQSVRRQLKEWERSGQPREVFVAVMLENEISQHALYITSDQAPMNVRTSDSALREQFTMRNLPESKRLAVRKSLARTQTFLTQASNTEAFASDVLRTCVITIQKGQQYSAAEVGSPGATIRRRFTKATEECVGLMSEAMIALRKNLIVSGAINASNRALLE